MHFYLEHKCPRVAKECRIAMYYGYYLCHLQSIWTQLNSDKWNPTLVYLRSSGAMRTPAYTALKQASIWCLSVGLLEHSFRASLRIRSGFRLALKQNCSLLTAPVDPRPWKMFIKQKTRDLTLSVLINETHIIRARQCPKWPFFSFSDNISRVNLLYRAKQVDFYHWWK